MSTGNKAQQNVAARSTKTKFNIDKVGDSKPPVINKIEVSSLQVDEAYGDECDPYNSTGQFLADAFKKKFDE